MSQEGQPRDARITFYIPENWLPLSPEEGGQQFVNFPVAQTANILFPGSISCSNLQSFAPTAPMSLYNNSTTGSIQIGNNSGYTGGIVINSNAVAPVANTVRIGDTSRPVIMSKVKLLDVEPINAAGVFVNCDMTIANGSELFVNEIKPNTITTVSLPNGATTTPPATNDIGSSRIVTSQWVRDQNFTTTAGFVTYNGVGPFTTLQTFNAGIKTNSIVTIAGNLNLPASTTDTPPVPDNTALVPTCNWVNSTITNALNATTLFAKLAGTTAFTVLQTFNLGIATNSIALVSGSSLTLPNILTNSIGLVSGSSLTLPNILTNSIGLVSGTTLSLPNILTNSIGLVSGTALSLPAATTTAPATNDAGSTRVVTSQWVRDQNFTTTAGFVTYSGAGPFTTLQTFSAGIKTDSIVTNTTAFLGLPPSTTTEPIVPDNTTKVPTTSWVNTTIANATAGFATYAGTTAFTALQTFNLGIATNSIVLVSGTTLSLPAATTTAPVIPDSSTLVPTTAWVTTTVQNAINGITGFATYAGTTAFTALQTFNGGVTINSATPLTITASTASETYNSGGPSAPTMKVLTGNTAGVSALSTTFYHYSVAGSGTVEPLRIFTTSSVATCQYMELTINGILTRSPGAPNIFSTKATFVIHNFNNNDAAGQIAMVNLAYPTQYSSNSNVATISTSAPSVSELRISITINKGNVIRQNLVATLVAYPSMGAAGANTNFTITAPAF